MKRTLEPELMTDEAQAKAYAEADFEDAHSRFVAEFRRAFPGREPRGCALDLGCGPGDITVRFARAYPRCEVHGLDGSRAMLDCGRKILEEAADVRGRITLLHGRIPEAVLPRKTYDAVISNSLLHHLPEPRALWDAVKRYAGKGAPVFIMDLKRPASAEEARRLVELYSGNEPEVLKQDFYNSLLAAFEPGEVGEQLDEAGLPHFSIREISDRHLVIHGLAR